jgi:hypothetical protein
MVHSGTKGAFESYYKFFFNIILFTNNTVCTNTPINLSNIN